MIQLNSTRLGVSV